MWFEYEKKGLKSRNQQQNLQAATAWSQLAEVLPALGGEEELALRGDESKAARWGADGGAAIVFSDLDGLGM